MSDFIAVSRSEVLSTASQFSQKQAELEGTMQQVKSQIGTMSSWRGDAQMNFIALMDQWNRETTNVHLVLGEVSQQLKQFEANISAVDTAGVFDPGPIAGFFDPGPIFDPAVGFERFRLEPSSIPPKAPDRPKIDSTQFGIRIVGEPLTAQNLLTIISALTELSTKSWLIAKGRFADLIEYTQTHNGRFAEEANVVVTRINYNSPMNMDWKVDLSAPSVAEALVTTIDGIVQVRKRLEQADLTNQAKVQEIKHAEQQADHTQQMAALEQEKQRLELEQRRLEVLEKQLEVQKKSIEYALEIAGKMVDTLHPGADPAARAMEIQALLPNIVQLQNGKGLELAFPVQPQNAK